MPRSRHSASRSLLLAQPRAIVLPGARPTLARRRLRPRAKSLAAPLPALARQERTGAGHAKNEIGVPDLRQGRFSANPKDPCLLLGDGCRAASALARLRALRLSCCIPASAI